MTQMNKKPFEDSSDFKILIQIIEELNCFIKDGNNTNDILIIRKFTAAALVIRVSIHIENNKGEASLEFRSRITEYKKVGLNLFVYLLICELREKTKLYKTLSGLHLKYFQMGEMEQENGTKL